MAHDSPIRPIPVVLRTSTPLRAPILFDYDAGMATEPDYYIVTFDTDRGPFPWAWELRRRSKPMGVRIREKGYQSQTAAEYAGKRALEDFLKSLAQEERQRPPRR